MKNKIYKEPIFNSLKRLPQLLAFIVLFSLPSITHDGCLNARLKVSVENQYQNVNLVSSETNRSSFIQVYDSNNNRIYSELGSNSNWFYVLLIVLILLFLYSVRKYEISNQLIKSQLENKEIIGGMFQNAPFAVVLTDKNGKVTSINDVFEVKFGYSQNELLGKKLDEFIVTEPSDNKKGSYSGNDLDEHQQVYSICKRRNKNGKLIDVELFTTPNFIGDKNFGYIIYYYDITKRLKIEDELEKSYITHREVLDTLQDAYFEGDMKGYVTYVNKAFVKATGYSNKEELIGKHFRYLVFKKSARIFLENFKKLYDTNRPIEPFDLQYVRKNGTIFSSEIVASPIIENDIAIGSRGIIRDISIRMETQAILKEAKDAAEYRVNELASINRVAQKVSSSLELQDVLNSICIELTNIFPIRSSGISLLNEEKTILEVLAFHSIYKSDTSARGILLHLDGSTETQNMIKTKKTVIIQDVQTDPRTKPIHELSKINGSKSYLIVPLISRGISIGTIGMPAKESDYKFTSNEIELAETIASQIASSIENARLHKRTEIALDLVEQDLEIGRQIQSGFFPTVLPKISGWDISTFFKPARQVSGDFYDFFQLGKTDQFVFVVADVCDKGVGAALFMVVLRSLIRSYCEQSIRGRVSEKLLRKIVENVNKYIVTNHGQSNMFATLVLGVLDSSNNKVYFVNGGQDPPLVLDSKGKLKFVLEPTGPAVGFSDEIPFEVGVVDFLPGDILLCYTDGLTEAKNTSGKFYSEERLLKTLNKDWPSSLSIIKHLEFDVLSHIGDHQQFDDITLLALHRHFVKESISHKMSFPAQINNLSTIRDFVNEVSHDLLLNSSLTETLALSVDEICSNIILHGYIDLKAGDIELKIVGLKNEVVVNISDTGHSFDPALLDSPNLSDNIDEREIGGLGFYFVKEMVDEMGYSSEDGINSLTLKIKNENDLKII